MRSFLALILCLAFAGCGTTDLHPSITKAHAIATVHAEELGAIVKSLKIDELTYAQITPEIYNTLAASVEEAQDLALMTGELYRLTGGGK